MNKDRDRLSSDILSALSRVYEEDRELLSYTEGSDPFELSCWLVQ